MNGVKTYRDSRTGLVGIYPETLAAHFPDLVEVSDDAKPLAYVPAQTSTVKRRAKGEQTSDASGDPETLTQTPDSASDQLKEEK